MRRWVQPKQHQIIINIFKISFYPAVHFIENERFVCVKTGYNTYLLIVTSTHKPHVYNLPAGAFSRTPLPAQCESIYLCLNTFYSQCFSNYVAFYKNRLLTATAVKFSYYKPIYFNRFKYVGKGFKLIFKKKKNFFNCIFGHSHIYWLKLQSIFVKKTKKYKYFFAGRNKNDYQTITQLLRNVKPINRYTLRGLRTYSHIWLKRRGRKSIATHV